MSRFYRFGDLRFSVSWKAYCYADERERRLVDSHEDDLALGFILDELERHYPGFKSQVLEDGQVRRFVNIYVNDEDVRYLGKLDAEVREGDVVSILPAVAGGSEG